MADAFLSMKNISKHYVGVCALDAVDFEIQPGEIHCLVGENGSGKSTLIKIISGAVQPDDGAIIEIAGERFRNPLTGTSRFQSIDAIRKGIEVIYQDLSLFPNLTVAENISFPEVIAEGRRLVNWRDVEQIAAAAMARVGVRLPLDALVGDISIADQQLVAICRALTRDVRLVIMDEPTASLTRKEVDGLFAVVKDLQAKGIATLFVSHKLDEVLQIAERVTVLRDGKNVGTFPSRELDDEKLTWLMTGKKLEKTRYIPQVPGTPHSVREVSGTSSTVPLLEVKNLSRRGNFREISFAVRAGEILGITGLLGSGRSELALALFGVSPPEEGEIRLEGRPVRIGSVQNAIRLGISYVPENRLVQGLVMNQSVGRNVVVTVLGRLLNRLGLIEPARVRDAIRRWVDELAIKAPSVDAPVQTLSGGNQQRVVLAKWLATRPKLLILDGPTVGIDVAAKSAIHEIIRRLAGQGIAIIMISDEIPEVFQNCNRALVMRKGRLIAEFDTARTTQEEIQDCVYAAA
jgi:simple sugar transport system ATP-binding protein